MTIHATGNNGGNPAQYCDSLTVTARNWTEARKLAALFRCLEDPEKRTHLLDSCGIIEQTLAEEPVSA